MSLRAAQVRSEPLPAFRDLLGRGRAQLLARDLPRIHMLLVHRLHPATYVQHGLQFSPPAVIPDRAASELVQHSLFHFRPEARIQRMGQQVGRLISTASLLL